MIWPLLAIGLLIVLTIPFSHFPSLSIRKFFTRFLQQIFLMYVVTELVNSRERLYRVMAVLLLTLFLVTIDVMAQYFWGRSIVHHTILLLGRVSGPMNHPNDLGTLLVTVLPLVLATIIACKRWIPLQVLVSLLFFLLAIALGLTSSRGAWLAFAVSMIAFGFCLGRRSLIIFTVLILLVFFWIFGMYCLSTRLDMYKDPMAHSPVMHPSLTNPFGLPAAFNVVDIFMGPSGRALYWGTAVEVIKHSPWFGCGYSAYVQALRDMHAGHEEYPHNSLLHITAELGFVGLALYGWLFVTLCLQGWRVLRTLALEWDLFVLGCGISCGILAWMIHSLLDTPWSSLQLSILLWLLIGIFMSLEFILPKRREL
jgi:O-antigen ligase